jgi:hypothetical protein
MSVHLYCNLIAVNGRLKPQKMRSESASDKRNGVVECFRMWAVASRTITVIVLPRTPKAAQAIALLKS